VKAFGNGSHLVSYALSLSNIFDANYQQNFNSQVYQNYLKMTAGILGSPSSPVTVFETHGLNLPHTFVRFKVPATFH
jgi:hypothetical protein